MYFPRKGVVIEATPALVIRLLNGAKVRVAQDNRFRPGDPAHILWDYTKNTVARIWTDSEYHDDGDMGEEPVEIDMGAEFVPDDVWFRQNPVGS